MRSGNYNAPWRRKKRTSSPLRIGLISLLLFACAAAMLYANRPGLSVARVPDAGRLQTPAMDLADEDTRKALRRLQAPGAFYRGQWLGNACIDGGADAPEIYVLTRHRMSSHGVVDPIRVTVRIDSGGEAVHETQDDIHRATAPRRHARTFDPQEAAAFRTMLVKGGYTQLPNDSERRDCFLEFTSLQSCIEGRYFGRVTSCSGDGTSSLSPLADAIEAFALGEQGATR